MSTEQLIGLGLAGDADRALEIIRHYGMNERCSAGPREPGFQHWLVDGQAPSGALSGESCFAFDPDQIDLKQVDKSWKIVNGRRQVLSFPSEHEARAAYRTIRKHGFSHFCFVGRPEPVFLYLRR